MSEEANSRNLQCLRCNQPLMSLGTLPLRAGGKSGAAAFWLGDMAEWGERIVHLEVHRCRSCSHLEFFDFDNSLPNS
ncbi:hypothetical protein IAD21_05742 [Abditibacteriota bacterium]|nr:hypothetical protein IAD21_05742 [Abditibacteriota bacterium]